MVTKTGKNKILEKFKKQNKSLKSTINNVGEYSIPIKIIDIIKNKDEYTFNIWFKSNINQNIMTKIIKDYEILEFEYLFYLLNNYKYDLNILGFDKNTNKFSESRLEVLKKITTILNIDFDELGFNEKPRPNKIYKNLPLISLENIIEEDFEEIYKKGDYNDDFKITYKNDDIYNFKSILNLIN